jgi:hypothetical protein
LSCAVFIGAAGGGVWQADNALAPQPNWHPSSNGIPSNAIGSLAFDPNDPRGKTLYAGTGEPNGSSDSEAGIGLYKSTDGGKNWTCSRQHEHERPVCAVATGFSALGAIAIDPANAISSSEPMWHVTGRPRRWPLYATWGIKSAVKQRGDLLRQFIPHRTLLIQQPDRRGLFRRLLAHRTVRPGARRGFTLHFSTTAFPESFTQDSDTFSPDL